MKLIDDCHHCWRLWSVRINVVGICLTLLQTIDPTALLALIQFMPGELQDAIPVKVMVIIQGALFGLSILARLIPQNLTRTPGRDHD